MTFDVYKHDTVSAVTAFLESPAVEATLTWDGAENYRIQPSARYCAFDTGHRSILTRTDLDAFLGGEADADGLQIAAQWLSDNQREWFNAAEDDGR